MAEQYRNKFTDIVWFVTEDKLFKDEIILEFHSFVRIISGEMKVIQADKSYLFAAGDTLLFPRNQLSAVIKRPKDGRPYKAVVFGLAIERLKTYYTKHKFYSTSPHEQKVKVYDPHPLLESFFVSLLPYFDLKERLPEDIATIKMEEGISILRSIDKDIDSLLTDFSEPGKISLPDFMEKNYMFNMPMKKFAYLTGRSLSTFNRDFKKAYHITPQRWLTQKRLEFAHYYITKNNVKPNDIYLEAGFENLSHFSSAFKRHFGYPPIELVK
ncbi:helix-turn-helix domain-containing protein [Pedobacter hiemivivus]|uniref:AraC family transcriptional regulator n=1 Tax=Pedobacter hiemivivus TaxID=2530454 RepID=A0A4R0NAB8_9SPHI|nr:AraC family transcriptional regulator [Pedobacter hiemivivus]TCC97160.1 AraC family transcriptional regulator [Pedobacter hiemivivus]